MKFKITTILLLIVSVFTYGQNSTPEHLVFKGVPIDGTLNQYVLKMKQSGFTYTDTEGGSAALKGDFAGSKDCVVSVSTLKDKDLVYKISVAFPEKDTWSALSGNYFELKTLLTEKYGSPSDVVETFHNSNSKDDGTKMLEVKLDRCKYSSIWKTDKGNIELTIDHRNFRCFVRLAYMDKFNSEIIRNKAKDDL